MTLSAFDIVINMIEVGILVWFVCNYLTLKPNTKFWHVLVLYTLIFTQLMISNLMAAYDVSIFVVASVTILLFAYFYTSNHIIEKLVISMAVMNLISILNMFTLVVVSTVFDRTMMEVAMSSGIDKTAAIVVSKLMFLAASIILVKFRKSLQTTFLSAHWWQFAIVMSFGMVSLAIMINFLYSHDVSYSLLLLAIFLTIALLVSVYYLFIQIQIESKKRYDDMLLIKELSFQKKSMDDILTVNDEMKKYRHDVKHVLDAAIGLTKDNQSEEAMEVLTKYQREIDVVQDYIVTGNSALDYVLNSKIMQGMKQGIRFKTMYAASSLAMDVDDLCVLIGNSLDNAIENCGGNEKEIHIEFRNVNEFVSVKIANTVDDGVLESNPKLRTTKQEKEMHGFGIKSMRYIAKKYLGEIDFIEEQGKFVCLMMFRH